jgi:hypothetical protein
MLLPDPRGTSGVRARRPTHERADVVGVRRHGDRLRENPLDPGRLAVDRASGQILAERSPESC